MFAKIDFFEPFLLTNFILKQLIKLNKIISNYADFIMKRYKIY